MKFAAALVALLAWAGTTLASWLETKNPLALEKVLNGTTLADWLDEAKARVGDAGPVCKIAENCPATLQLQVEVLQLQLTLLETINALTIYNSVSSLYNFNLEYNEYWEVYGSPLPGATPVNANNQNNTFAFSLNTCASEANITQDYKTGTFTPNGATASGYGEWIVVQPIPNLSSDPTCDPKSSTLGLGSAPTCATVCARKKAVCDPCAIALTSCQDNLYYALGQGGYDTKTLALQQQRFAEIVPEQEQWGQFAYDTRPRGPWNQTACPTQQVANATSSLPGEKWGQYPGLNGQYICDQGNQMQPPKWVQTSPSDLWRRPPNFWQPLQDNYVDPATLCDIPLWRVTPSTPGLAGAANVGALCYCKAPNVCSDQCSM